MSRWLMVLFAQDSQEVAMDVECRSHTPTIQASYVKRLVGAASRREKKGEVLIRAASLLVSVYATIGYAIHR
ncbi:hypothetical protein [Nostoc sp.]|uniref:hypothetical protein n=1 Tax=Nostoc sp. TaxID=1180 RepID=UPI002FF5A480